MMAVTGRKPGDRLWVAVAVVLAFQVAVVLLWIRHYQFNVSALVFMDGRNVVVQRTDPGPNVVIIEDGGYDGMYYYYAALDPFFRQGYAPPYNAQRFLYPLVVHIVSGGNRSLVPFSMVAVNLVAVGLSVYVLGLLLRRRGQAAWYAVFYGTCLGLIPAMHYDLTEPLAVGLILLGTYWYEKRGLWLAALFFSLAVLTRESCALVVAVLGFYELAFRRDGRAFGVLALSGLPFVALQAALYARFGFVVALQSAGILGMPFVGIFRAFSRINLAGGLFQLSRTVNFVPFLVFCLYLLVLSSAKLWRDKSPYVLVVVVHLILAFFFAGNVWGTASNSARLLVAMFPFVVLSFAGERNWTGRLVFVGLGLLTLMDVMRLVIAPGHPYRIT